MMGQKGSLKTGFRFQAAFYWALTVCQSAFQAASPLIFRAVRQLLPRRHFRRHSLPILRSIAAKLSAPR